MASITKKFNKADAIYFFLSTAFLVDALGLPLGRIISVGILGILVIIHLMKLHGLTPVVSSSFKRQRSLVLTLRVRKISIHELMLVVLRFVAIKVNWEKERVKLQKPIFLSISAFLIFSIISLNQSIDVNKSGFAILELFTLIGIMAVGVFLKDKLVNKIPNFLLGMGIALCTYSLLLNTLQPIFLLPKDGYQLVFSKFGSHNHLGDFLVLPMLVCLYLLVQKRNYLYPALLLFYFPFFLLSYSRSAYLSFFLVGSVFLVNVFWKPKIKQKLLLPMLSFVLISSIVLLFFFATVFESKYSPVLDPVHRVLSDNFGLKFKHFGANRIEYWNTAIQSVKEKPFFGVGPGNFVHASQKYSSIPNYTTHSSHNIFLDILAENGIFAFISFLAFIIIVLVNSDKKSIFFYLTIALLINFQIDYTHRIYSMLLLFFITLALAYNPKQINA